ncbi:MAG TPA: SpoIIE family protein phosphatase [Bryobacteraceae bacterium]|nr:SpoIIE family protein phosphatase [Bryobacteraceae bacterium]
MSAAWRRYRIYIPVVPLCAAGLLYQIAYTVVGTNAALHGPSMSDAPFSTSDGTVGTPHKAAEAVGLHTGDRILSVDGAALTDQRQLWEAVNRHHPGDLLTVTEIPKGHSDVRTLRILVPALLPYRPTLGELAFTFGLFFVMLLCVLTGVYVILRRPYDKRAWLAFGMMLSLSQVVNFGIDWYLFPEPLWLFAKAWRLLCVLNWSFVISAFGFYFPEQFEWDKRRPWIKWLYLGPLVCINVLQLIDAASAEIRFHAFPVLHRLFSLRFLNPSLLIAMSIALFFACIGVKQGKAKNRDVKRRLRLLEAGACIGLGPIGLLLLYQTLFNHGSEKGIPEALLFVICFLFTVFPLTLAYTVLTERAMDLRVVVRQGMRYTLARGGLRALIAVFGLLFFTALSSVLFRPGVSDTTKVTVYTLTAIAFVILVRRVRSQLFVVIDRKFFREHYNAEVLLGDLTENVHSIMDEQQLLQTVSRRVSDALHISHFSVLMSGDSGFRPVYALGLDLHPQVHLPEDSKAVALLESAKEPAPIYFDRPDNWVHAAPEPELVTLKELGAQLLLPLKAKEKLLGLFCLGPKLSEEPFSKTDINLLRSVALQTGLALDNSRLTAAFAQEVAQRERLNREIEIAREVQERLFPQQLPLVAGIDYYGACRPALGVGGDYYDFLSLANGDLGVAIGDVSGKGIAAALLMASLQASLRGQALTGLTDLAHLMSNVNRLVYDATPSNRYATFFYGQYSQQTRIFRYVNAGHNPPFVLRKTKAGTVHVIRLDTGGPVVGLFPEAPYQQGSLTLEPGDVFVGFTDGISEAMNRADEEWGEEQLIPTAAANADKSAAEIIPFLMAEADRFSDGAPQHDDMTLVVVKMQAEVVGLAA